jgi:hypothetical protein
MGAALVAHIQRDGIAHGLDLHTGPKREFLETFERLVLVPRGLDHRVQFTGPTGANAVEAALKLARKVTGRRNVVAFTNGFHGVSQGALAATGNGHHRMAGVLSLPDVTRLPYDGYVDGLDSLALLDELLFDPSGGIDPPAAVLLETVQGEGGLNVASPPWLRGIAAVAARQGALLIRRRRAGRLRPDGPRVVRAFGCIPRWPGSHAVVSAGVRRGVSARPDRALAPPRAPLPQRLRADRGHRHRDVDGRRPGPPGHHRRSSAHVLGRRPRPGGSRPGVAPRPDR